MKKLISVLLALAMVLSLMPLSVFATEEETQVRNPVVELYVGTVNALETPQGEGWSFDAESGVLTLNNCTLTESMLHVETDEYGSYRYDAMIYVKGDLTIELIGTNSVERVIEEAPTDYTKYYAICNSIYCPSDWEMPGSLTFVGDGNLTVGVAVSRDYLSEDGYSTNEAWEYLEFSSGIGSWNYTDLSGLYGGGWMDIYGGVYGVEAPYIACAFANYPTFGDNCIVTAYRDVEGTIENENGYNWNNNDAWRMKVVTGDAYLKPNGQLILLDNGSASGEGWTWHDSVLTLSADTAVKAVEFRRTVDSAKLTLTGDVTLDATDMGYDANWNSISAVVACCDLEIDAGDHTLTLHNSWADALRAELCDVTVSGGTVVATNEGGYAINMIGGDLTVQNATFRSANEIYLTEGNDADYNTVPAGDAVLDGAVVVLDSPITSYGALTILDSEVTVTAGYEALCGSTAVTIQDSDLTVTSSGYALKSNGKVTVDNCNLDLTAEECVIYRNHYHYEGDDESNIPNTDCIGLQNMDIVQPEGWSVRLNQTDYSYYTQYEVELVDGDGNPATVLKTTAAGNEHEHSYENGICSCGAKQTFTVTWYNWDGTVLEVDTVQYGETPEYNGPTPTRTGVGYDYTFYAWGYNSSGSQTGTPGPATANQHWHAKFTSVAHKHYLIFMDSDGVTELGRFERSYNQSIIITTANLFTWAGKPTKDCYTLSGWYRADGLTNSNFYMPDHDVVFVAIWDGPDHTWVEADCDTPKTCSVCGETEGEALPDHNYVNGVCACGKKQTFTITWKNDDGTILEVDTVEYGDHPEYNGPTPTKTGEGYEYTFYAWSNGTQYTNVEQVTVTRDWTYTAGYNKIAHKHDLIFMDGDVELARQEVNYNSSLSSYTLNSYAGNPAKDCYTLSGWAYADGTQLASNVYLNMPDEDVVLYAVWDGPNHTWVDATCEAPKTCSVCGETEGEALGHSWVDATCEAPKTCSGCGLTEGEALGHEYTEGVCACGKKQTFTITWKNWDGTVLETDTVEYGTVPTYDGATPTRPNVGYDFMFYGWALSASGAETTIGAATQDRTYYAKYTSSIHYHDIIFMDQDMVTELGRYETYYDKLIATSWLTTASGITVPPCYTAWWHYEDGSMPEESFRMPDHDVVLYLMMEGPGHVYDGVITTEPTCTQEGVMTYTCIGCGDSYTDSLWPKGHSYQGVVTEPTCTEGGYTTYTCSDCGDSYVGDQVAAHGHDYCNYVTTEPTCTTDGYTTYSCMFCGDSYVTDIVEGGHKFGVIYITNATCTEYGSSSGTCIVCGELVTDDAYEEPLGHDYVAVVTTAPSCSAAGVMTYTCSRCDDSYTEEIAALAHDFSAGAQCTTCGTDAEASVSIRGVVNYYATAYEASLAVQYCTEEDNALIVLVKDIVLEKSFDRYISLKNCVCTLDLNGKTVYGNSKNYEPIRVRFDSDVTIVDSVGTGKVTGGANTFGVVYSTLTVNGGTFIGTQYGASSSGDSTVIINGGTFEGKYGGCFYDCDVIINGGTFTGTEYGLYVRKTGGDTSTITINGGTISGTVCDIYVYSAESTVTLSAGENAVGATFPGGISIGGTDLGKRPLNALLGEDMTYWCNGSAVAFADDMYEFAGGDVTVRKICQHSFENGICTGCGQKDPNYVAIPTLTLDYPTLSFEDEILYNVYYTLDDATGIVEMGLITFATRDANGTMDTALDVIPGFVSSGSTYMVQSKGIPAKNLSDAVYFKVYAKLTDGSYVYSDVAGYHAVAYANTVLNSDAALKAKALVVAMLNYGAAAQEYFGYKTDFLMNANLTAEQQGLVSAYDESMVQDVVKAESSKVGSFVMNGGYSNIFPTVSFEGAFAINFYFTPSKTVDAAPVMYYWDAKTYNAVDVLTPENATGVLTMAQDGSNWGAAVEGIAAKALDDTIYVAGFYTSDGVAYPTGVIAYSLGNYCKTVAANGTAFGAATAVYGYYAKAYFN